jgi:hypothetical protein
MQPKETLDAVWGADLIRSGWLEEIRLTWGLSYRGLAMLLDSDGNTVRGWCEQRTQHPKRSNALRVARFQERYTRDVAALSMLELTPADLTPITEVGMRMGVGPGTIATWAHEQGLRLVTLEAMGVLLRRTEVSYLRRKVRP